MSMNLGKRTLRILTGLLLGTLLPAIGSVWGATYVVTTTSDSGAGSLRQAIIDSNNNPATDTITFAIPGVGPHTIDLLSALPDLTSTVTINGYTQAGASPNSLASGNNAVLMIELNGTGAGLNAAGLVVKTSSSTIKGLAINGFRNSGIIIDFGQVFNSIQGNFIGVDVAGETLVGNRGQGVEVLGNNNIVGGSCLECGNIIAGNLEDGVFVLDNSIRNSIWHNSIFSNGGTNPTALGIDLYLPSRSGANANDNCDADGGSNFLQNFPVLTSAESDGTSTTIIGTLNSAPSTTFVVEFFAGTKCDKVGNGEGETFLGVVNATTGAGAECLTTFSKTLPLAVADGTIITATATDPNGNTSEFSKCFTASGPQPHDLAVVSVRGPRRINLRNEGPPATRKITVAIQNRSPHNEVISTAEVLHDLVTLSVESLPPSTCGNLVATLVLPPAFPITLPPKKQLTLGYNVTFSCANDPLGSSRTAAHDDYRLVATVDHAVLDGEEDSHPEDDTCPHGPLPGGFDQYPDGRVRDKGCGSRDATTGLTGADVLIDLVVR